MYPLKSWGYASQNLKPWWGHGGAMVGLRSAAQDQLLPTAACVHLLIPTILACFVGLDTCMYYLIMLSLPATQRHTDSWSPRRSSWDQSGFTQGYRARGGYGLGPAKGTAWCHCGGCQASLRPQCRLSASRQEAWASSGSRGSCVHSCKFFPSEALVLLLKPLTGGGPPRLSRIISLAKSHP